MRFLTAFACVLSLYFLVACSKNLPCTDPVELKAERRKCAQLQEAMATARERKNWQMFGAKQEQFERQCERLLYYRQDFSDEGLKTCPNRGMPEERNPKPEPQLVTEN